jgi:hypothetical protein
VGFQADLHLRSASHPEEASNSPAGDAVHSQVLRFPLKNPRRRSVLLGITMWSAFAGYLLARGSSFWLAVVTSGVALAGMAIAVFLTFWVIRNVDFVVLLRLIYNGSVKKLKLLK